MHQKYLEERRARKKLARQKELESLRLKETADEERFRRAEAARALEEKKARASSDRGGRDTRGAGSRCSRLRNYAILSSGRTKCFTEHEQKGYAKPR
jgi:hypothetical protein